MSVVPVNFIDLVIKFIYYRKVELKVLLHVRLCYTTSQSQYILPSEVQYKKSMVQYCHFVVSVWKFNQKV